MSDRGETAAAGVFFCRTVTFAEPPAAGNRLSEASRVMVWVPQHYFVGRRARSRVRRSLDAACTALSVSLIGTIPAVTQAGESAAQRGRLPLDERAPSGAKRAI